MSVEALAPVATPSPVRARAGLHLRMRGHHIPVVLPTRRDPRLRLAAVIMALQVLGQTVLGFKLSVAQILVSIGFCAAIELALTYREQKAIIWPASAILTGNSTAFILRAAGTRPGDWWSLNGIQFFLIACAIGMISKHLLRPGGKHLYNPSNLGLVAVLLIVGTPNVFPQYLWWGPLDWPVELSLGVILLGFIWVLKPVRMYAMALSFLVVFAAAVAALAATGHCFLAIWHGGEVCGGSYWQNVLTSPEVLIFVFFMMSDPRTAPAGARARIYYGAGTALVAAALIAPQSTEFGIKVAILASLTVTCSLVPVLEWLAGRRRAGLPALRARFIGPAPVQVAIALILVAVPAATIALASNPAIIQAEIGHHPPGTPGQ